MLFNIIRTIFKFIFHVKLNNQNNIPLKSYQKLLIVPNHVSFLDGILLALFLPIKPVFAVYTTIANQWYMKILSPIISIIPLDHRNPMAIKRLIKEIEKGRPIVIFPEGRLTVTGSMMKIYEGTAFIAAKSQATILPIWLDGPERSYFSRLKKPFNLTLFPKITITILKATHIAMSPALKASERRKDAGIMLQSIMCQARFDSRPSQNIISALLTSAQYFGMTRKIMGDINFKKESYRSFIRKVLAVKTLLNKVSPDQQRIGLLLPNSIIASATIFACLMSQRIPALLNYTAGSRGIRHATTAAKVKLVITSRQFLEKGKLTFLPDQLSELTWFYLEDLKPLLTFQDKISVLLNSFYPERQIPKHDPQDEAVIFFTSGSEGYPKGVVHSHASLLANVEQIRSVIDVQVTDRFLSTLPLFHAFGFTAGMLIPLLSGAELFLYPNPLHNRIIPELFYDQHCTVLLGTPTFLNNYAKYAHPYDFAFLRYVIAGAEKLAEETQKIWSEKFGARILEGYGVTECAPIIALNTPMSARQNSVGKPLPNISVKLEKIAGVEKGGRLFVKGPNIMKGYLRVENPGILQAPDNINSDEWKGWYDTGDIVDINQQGFITILGRAKRFAKIAGEMVSLESVEKLIKSVYPDNEHAVLSIKDERKGEQLILMSTKQIILRETLLHAAQQQGYPAISIPKDIRYIDKLPLLGTGKIDLVQLQKIITE